MNPSFKIKALQVKVCKGTEEAFNEEFWSNQNFIIYAVDSVGERKYTYLLNIHIILHMF